MKIIASDYDGTLRRRRGIEQKDREAVEAWRGSGNLFGVVTGRDEPFIEHMVAEDKLEIDFIIIYNGADIYEFDGARPTLVKRILGESGRLREMLPLILRKPGDWAEFITPGGNYYFTYGDERGGGDSRGNWFKAEALSDVREFTQIYALYETEGEALEVARCLSEGFGGDVSPLVNGSWLNVAPAGVTKATGVLEYAKLKSVSKQNIYAIGDSYNDMAMIREFNGFTLENGADDLKKIARAVYAGVWELVRDFNG